MVGLTDSRTDGLSEFISWMEDRRISRWMDGCMDRWKVGWMDEWMDGRIDSFDELDGWMDG